MTEQPTPSAIVVGAGLSGLVAARELVAATAGWTVTVFEAASGIGGRVQTRRHPDGYLLDRGFQVLLSAYPALRRHVDLDALGSLPFDAGASIWTGQRLVTLADPLRHPTAVVRDALSNVFSLKDKLLLARWAVECRRADWESAASAATEHGEDRSGLDALQARGFSKAFIDRFARPFWGGITLDPSLSVSEGVLDFTLKMFIEGSAVLPAAGIAALPDELARTLPEGSVQANRRVTSLLYEDSRVVGVRIGEEEMRADAVIVATDSIAAKELTGIEAIPTQAVGSVTVYLAGNASSENATGKRLVLDGTGRRQVNHIAPLSAVQPSYAPAGKQLVAAVLLGDEMLVAPDATLEETAVRDVTAMLGTTGWEVVGIERVPFSLYAQPPGIHRRLPDATTGIEGLYLASDATVDSSVNGAMLSGEAAARAARNATVGIAEA
ncbi:MAG: NAD(P)/FAD-dependent oxidoreductase [Thermomicrobiales bacterium]